MTGFSPEGGSEAQRLASARRSHFFIYPAPVLSRMTSVSIVCGAVIRGCLWIRGECIQSSASVWLVALPGTRDVHGISSGTGTVKKVGDKRRGGEDVADCKQKIAVVNRRV